jgi:probable HAF family extracellular repeat protein
MITETCVKTGTLKQSFAASRLSRPISALLILGAILMGTPSWSQAIYNSPANPVASKLHPQVDLQTPAARTLPDLPGVREKLAQNQAASRKVAPTPQSTQYSFVNIDIANAAYVQPTAINDAGIVVGYYGDANNTPHGFVWQSGTVQTIDYPGALQTAPTGVNNRGVIFGTYNDANYNTYAFTYSLSNGTWTELPALPGSWRPYFGVGGINDKGEIVGTAAGFIGLLSWEWHPESQSYSYFTSPAASEGDTVAVGINNKGSKFGSMSVVDSSTPFLFLLESGDGNTPISLPSGLALAGIFGPFGINDSDAIVGTCYTANFASVSGFIRYRNGAFVVVNQPGADQTYLTGINDLGVLVGDTYNPTTGASPGFIAFPLR